MDFEDVVIDGVVAAHTNQWAGILVGGGPFYVPPDAPLNRHVIVRNSSVEDVYGDGIVLFRDADGLIENSSASQTGMQSTQTVGTPNAIWTWTCTDCIVRDNEAFLTDSPGVDGGAYDIDWSNTRNTVERNYAHDTQGYCIAVFAAAYVTSESVVRDNLCIANGLSPRLAALQGAVYLSTWNGGVIHGLRIEHNTIVWQPPVARAAAIVNDTATEDPPVEFIGNRVESSSALIYRSNAQLAPSSNTYLNSGDAFTRFTWGAMKDTRLQALQAAGIEKGSTLASAPPPLEREKSLRIDAWIKFALDADGLLAPGPRAQLMVLRSLAAQYGPRTLTVNIHLNGAARDAVHANALLDLDAGPIRFYRERRQAGIIRVESADRHLIQQWRGFQNAATLGSAVRARLGAPHFAFMRSPSTEANQ
jgi:hypothetical protein